MLSPTQQKKLEKLAKVGDIAIADELNALESRLEGLEAIVPALREAEDGKDGYTPVKGIDYEDGKDGEDYVLTETDKQDIAKSIKVPVIEKVIEKTETIIKEQPIVTNEIVEVAVINPDELPQYAKQFRDGLELLQGDERLKATAIDGLDKEVTDRAISIVDNRTSYLINRINNLPTTGGASAFTALTDVPSSYASQANKVLRVKATEDGLEFATNSATVAWGGVTGTLSNQTDLQTALNGKASSLGVDDNYVTDAEKTKLSNLSGTNTGDQDLSGYSLTSHNHTGVYEPADSTILKDADIGVTVAAALGVNDNYVTDAEKTVIGNTNGTNTGDNAVNSNYSGLATSKVDANVAITGATKTKVTYDTKGLVTSGADATTADIADSLNKRYVTDANLTTIGNQSGTNTGDNAVNTLYSGLVTNATHTGDATGSTALTVVKINGVALSGLATGLLKNTTGTGVPSIAVNSDLPVMSATVGGAVPTPPNNTTTFLRGDGTFAAPTASATITTQDEGTPLSSTVTTLNFTGAGVTASGAGATTTIDIPGGSGAADYSMWALQGGFY